MQAEPNAFQYLWDFFKAAGPVGAIAAYIIYRDLYNPWKEDKRKRANGHTKFEPTNYVREGDFAGLSQSVRDFKERYDREQEDLKEQCGKDYQRLEGYIDSVVERILTIERRRD